MSARAWGVLGVVLAMLAVGQGYAQPILTQVVTVPSDASALFSLAIGDVADYAFVLIEMPSNGILIGVPPHLTYIPRRGFSGADWVTFAATSPGGALQLGTVQILVLGPGEEMSMPALLAEGEMVFSGPAFAVDRYRFAFGLQQRFRFFEQSVRAEWTGAGFISLVGTTRFELEGAVPSPWRLPITSTLNFDPPMPGLRSWVVDARTTLLGATWISTFFYSGTDPQTGSHATFQVQGTIGAFTFDNRIRFATLTPTFGEGRLILKGPWICDGCPTNWEIEYRQTKAGFERLSFLARDITIPCPGCGGLQIFFDIRVTFTVDRKTVAPTLRIVSRWVAHMRPFVALETPPYGFGLEGIDVYGVEIRCEVPGGYTLRLATSFNPLRDSRVTGYAQFFQMWRLEGPVVPCCGSPGRFQLSAYFKRASGNLFGFGMGNLVVFFPLSRELLLNVGLKVGEVDPRDPARAWILTVGWRGLF